MNDLTPVYFFSDATRTVHLFQRLSHRTKFNSSKDGGTNNRCHHESRDCDGGGAVRGGALAGGRAVVRGVSVGGGRICKLSVIIKDPVWSVFAADRKRC